MQSAFIFLFVNVAIAAKLPAGLKRCHRADTDCLKDAIQDSFATFAKGIRSLGVAGIDPLLVPQMQIPGGSGQIQLTQTFKDGRLYGLSTIKIEELKFNVGEGQSSWKFHCPNITFTAHYEMSGQMMVFPVKGRGQMVIYLENVFGEETLLLKKIKKNNQEYIRVANTSLVLDAEKVTLNFENLFDGNKQMSDQINQVLNENWKTVFDELKYSYNNGFKEFVDNLTNRFFEQVPISEIFLD